jgi:exopolyphosphatase/pppGpp-phosphohydrolase
VQRIRAVATSAVREARNSELFLDRVRGRTGIAFDIINEAEEAGSSILPDMFTEVFGRQLVIRLAGGVA